MNRSRPRARGIVSRVGGPNHFRSDVPNPVNVKVAICTLGFTPVMGDCLNRLV
jgi:hypothetical protein